eukprot:CAMPEP_0185732154 /NCGR_PEP_ID=MMETSP1171-20130828/15194_1 /TAXON_ID=374046 /ORGANISM="Helicotheca tamensis, Strain CCMP826" /LENGTH=267 /DNA_ID=CAMNT_0028401571 /DNA_START=66 /DNA_END=869 /DNA_ORIENTATION=+
MATLHSITLSIFTFTVILTALPAADSFLALTTHPIAQFTTRPSWQSSSSTTSLEMAYGKYGNGRSSSRYGTKDRSKRQERVGHVVRTELSSILQKGYPIKYADYIDDALRRRISVVNADVSPDLRQARITISLVDGGKSENAESGYEENDKVVDQRRAYSWLVKNTKMIRHALAQNLKHMKTVPDLTFAQVDVGAAVDVMNLIEKVSKGYKRESVGQFGGDDDSLPFGMSLEDEEEEWMDEDDFDGEDDDFVFEDYDDEEEEEKVGA